MKLLLQVIKALFRKVEASLTHWDTRRIVTKEYTFDGNIDSKETIQIDEYSILVKVADTFPEVSSVTNLSIAYTSIPDGLVDEYELSPIDDVRVEGDVYIFDTSAFYVPNGSELSGVHIPSGLYFAYRIDDEYTSKLSVTYNDGELKKLDKKYLPDEVIDSIDIANNAQTTANNAQTTANEAQSAANSKMNSNNPVGSGSFSMGRKSGSVVGSSSHAEGSNTTASGSNSHAEGLWTTASGSNSHAEGSNTTASSSNSHAEGLWTIAGSSNQHVQGKYNVVDSQSKYAHIVGNGKNETTRSNAYTLTWSGIPWYQGRPQFGGTAMDNGSQTVMANGDKEIILASSTSNSTKKFKITVDDRGTISATEVT